MGTPESGTEFVSGEPVEPQVRARALQGFSELLGELGADAESVLAEAGIGSARLQRPDGWMEFSKVVHAYEIAARVSGVASFGMQLAMKRDLSYLGELLLIFRYSDNLEGGLLSAAKYLSIQNTGFQVSLESEANEAVWAFRLDEKLSAETTQWIEESMLTAVKLIRVMLGEDYQPRNVRMRHAPISSGETYAGFFGNSVTFDAMDDALVLHRDVLKNANPLSDQHLFEFLTNYLDSRILTPTDDIVSAVSRMLEALIPTGKFSVDIVAEQLGMHRRTLQRRLDRAGKSYVEILDDCRSRMATDFLQSSDLPMVNLALMLGYADQSAFNHAFKRWHGVSPRYWRQKGDVSFPG